MKTKGFTLVELLIVIIIVTILSAVAIPTYIKTVEKARSEEAITNLKLIYDAEGIYRLENDVYIPDSAIFTSILILNPDLYLDIKQRSWDYEILGEAGGTTFLAFATRNSGSSPYLNSQITINQDGTWGGGGSPSPFVPAN